MSLKGMGNVSAPISGSPPSGFTAVSSIFQKDVTYTPGAIAALLGAVTTTTVTGLLTTDQVFVQCTGTMTAGAAIANARVSASNTLEITFTTAVALGVTLGSLTFRVTVFR
jgi:hypothetical protein